MDDLLDIFKIFKFLRRLANFPSMPLWQKALTVIGGVGLLLSLIFTVVAYFMFPTLEAEDFQLSPAHQTSYNACQGVGSYYETDYLGDVTTTEACGCYARHWAHEYDADYQSDIGPALTQMISLYDTVEILEEDTHEDIKKKFVAEYGKRAGTLTDVPRTASMMRQQMGSLMDISATCLNFLSYDDAGLAAMLALNPYGSSTIEAPQNEAEVVIALRGSSDATELTALND